MIIGSGLIASAMRSSLADQDIYVFAAGVSNSGCKDETEFVRERARLSRALLECPRSKRFIYFGTCSVSDPDAAKSMYVQHKLAMESLVSCHPKSAIFRLPQVAGRTPNPHTLLNYLYARIARSERFSMWSRSTRNVLDIDDVAKIVRSLIVDEGVTNEIIHIAHNYSVRIFEIVAVFEEITRKVAIFDEVELGSAYAIDCSRIRGAISRCGIDLGGDYLNRVLRKYYA
jgi:nucleoside-diphosphate-sugar epimerase